MTLLPATAATLPLAFYIVGTFLLGGLVGGVIVHLRSRARWAASPPPVATVDPASERAGQQFVTRMGHELRTPLNSVIGFTGILLKNTGGNLNSRQLLFLSRIRDNGLHLLALVDHLLEAGRVDGGPRVRLTPVSIPNLVRGTVDELADAAAEDNVTLETQIPYDLAPITTDEYRFQLALRSLVRGALPLAERGNMTVRVAALDDGRPERIDIAVTGTMEGSEAEVEAPRPEEPASVPAEVTLAASLYHLLGYTVTAERTSEHAAVFSVRLARPVSAA